MNKITLNQAVELAIENMIADGLDDVLPTPLEIELIRSDPGIKKYLKETSVEKINLCLSSPKKALDLLALMPLSHVLVPKKEAFDFRKVAIIRPEDLVIYQAIAIMIADPFEKVRRRVARGRVFSYRFDPRMQEGRLFSQRHNFRSFRDKSGKKAARKSAKFFVKCDVANFYDRINIHRIESTLLTIQDLDQRYTKLINQMLLHWAKRDSYGLPVGSNGSRVLAEVAMFNVDRALYDANVDFIRFVDDFRIFTKTATEAHSVLEMLIGLLGREGLFINTRKSSIKRLAAHSPKKEIRRSTKAKEEKAETKDFRIFAGYGGTIPIKFRVPTKHTEKKYQEVDLHKSFDKINSDDKFAKPKQIKEVLFGIIVQKKYDMLTIACDLVETFPQFYPLLVDILIKNAQDIPKAIKRKITKIFSDKIQKEDFLSEYIQASLINLVGHEDYFDRDAVMSFIRSLRRNAGAYVGRAAFDAAQNLVERTDALEIRDYFDRSNEWERRRIIKLMSNVLPKDEYKAWRRAIKTYISKDPFALTIK